MNLLKTCKNKDMTVFMMCGRLFRVAYTNKCGMWSKTQLYMPNYILHS